MKMSLTYLVLFWFAIANGQSFNSISHYYKQQQQNRIDTLVNFAKNKNNNAWLNLLPSVNYDVDRSSLNIGISLSNFSNYYQQKQRNKIELVKLKVSLAGRLETNLLRLENDYLKLRLEVKLQKSEYQNLKNESLYVLLKKEQFLHNKFILEDWLKVKNSYLQKLNKKAAENNKLLLKANVFKTKLKYSYVLDIEDELQNLNALILMLKSQIK